MKKSFIKDIFRTIKNSKRRFAAIMIITALGVTVLTGIYAASKDMYHSADSFYDSQNLFDIRILSTLGLTQEDVEALKQVTGIENAEGSYSETVKTNVEGTQKDAEVIVLSENNINTPYLKEGALPKNQGEIAVTPNYIEATGKKVGDTITFEENIEVKEEQTVIVEEVASEEIESKVATTDDKLNTDIDWDAEVDIEEEKETPNFIDKEYTISGVVLDPLNISNSTLTFRASSAPEYTFFIKAEDAVFDVYSAVYVKLPGLTQLSSFSKEYEDKVQGVVDIIQEDISASRQQARYDSVMGDALDLIADAQSVMDEKFAEADNQFAEAWLEIEDAKKEITNGEEELTSEEKKALKELADARKELKAAKTKLDLAQIEIVAGQEELLIGEQDLLTGKSELETKKATAQGEFAAAEAVFAQKQGEIASKQATLTAAYEQLKLVMGDKFPQSQWDQLVNGAAATTAEQLMANPQAEPNMQEIANATQSQQNELRNAIIQIFAPVQSVENLEVTNAVTENQPPQDPAQIAEQSIQSAIGMGVIQGSNQVLNAQKSAYETQKSAALQQMQGAEQTIAAAEAQIAASKAEIETGKMEIEQGLKDWEQGESKLNKEESKALKEISDGWKEIAEGKKELVEGESELIENEEKYADKKAEANEKIEEAYVELEDIDMAEWYVQDRTALDSYTGLKTDMSSIQAIGNAFPVVFLIVAILISLTTMTRMVEEERGLTGTYKALGFKNSAIYTKYIMYAFLACLAGGIIGDVLGFLLMPTLLINILKVMYTIPEFFLSFDAVYGFGGVLLFMVFIVAATAITCHQELKEMPAALMRPKAPKAGSRIMLERIPLIWNKMKFLNKVTARNLFRYKKRLFMTVLGIAGCTALVLIGFAIKDSVTQLMPKQYEETYHYDLLSITENDDNEEWINTISKDENIEDVLNLQISSFKITGANGYGESVQLMVVPTGVDINKYISTNDINGKPVKLDSSGVLVTQNAAELLNLKVGDSINMQNMQLDRKDVTVANIVKNYLGNNVFITEELYQDLYKDYTPNGVLANFSSGVTNQAEYTAELLKNEILLAAFSTQAQKADFSTNFTLMNSVVYIFIVLAAGLAFVVLFTLSNTNISERLRELATIKVLGFFDREVHSYVNKETIILTLIGIAVGLPMGTFLSGLLTAALKMPGLYFAVSIHPLSYLISAVLAFCFAIIVNLMINRTLDRINMVEALKSVE